MNLSSQELESLLTDNPDLKIELPTATVRKSTERRQNDKSDRVLVKADKLDGQAKESCQKRQIRIKQAYIKNLSVNHYKIKGRYTLPEVKAWKNDLVQEIMLCGVKDWQPPLRIEIEGFFKDLRSTPDIHNLTKIIADCVQKATGLNDRYYETETKVPQYVKGQEPYLIITIEEIEEEDK
jgi:Holliday junction resolvase RusA-like endonuclease